MNLAKLDTVASHAVYFITTKEFNKIVDAHNAIIANIVSLSNRLADINDEIGNATYINARIMRDAYLEDLGDMVNSMNSHTLDQESLDDIINMSVLVSDSMSEHNINPGDIGVDTKQSLYKIIEDVNSALLDYEDVNKSLFSTCAMEVEQLLERYFNKSFEIKELINNCDNLRLGAEVAMDFMKSKLFNDPTKVDLFIKKGFMKSKADVREFILDNKVGEFVEQVHTASPYLQSYCGDEN